MHCICINKKSFLNKTHITCIPDDKFRMRPRLAVCVKGIFYPDPSAVSRLVEWLELQFILGVEKIFVHYISLSPEALTMLKHYEQRGLVVLKEVVWAGPYLRYCDCPVVWAWHLLTFLFSQIRFLNKHVQQVQAEQTDAKKVTVIQGHSGGRQKRARKRVERGI